MPTEKLSLEDVERVTRLYAEGNSVVTLSHFFSVSSSTIYRVLKKAGQKTEDKPSKLSPQDVEYAKRLYSEGSSSEVLGPLFSVSPGTIIRALKKIGCKIKNQVELHPPKLSPEDVEHIKRLYTDGSSATMLGRRFSVNYQTIIHALKKAGCTTRNSAEAHSVMTSNAIEIAATLYQQGMSSIQIAKLLKMNSSTIRNNLLKKGVTLRSCKILDNKQENELVNDYLHHTRIIDLCRSYGVPRHRIYYILQKRGIKIGRINLTRAEIDMIRFLALCGYSISYIARKVNRSWQTVRKYMRL